MRCNGVLVLSYLTRLHDSTPSKEERGKNEPAFFSFLCALESACSPAPTSARDSRQRESFQFLSLLERFCFSSCCWIWVVLGMGELGMVLDLAFFVRFWTEL